MDLPADTHVHSEYSWDVSPGGPGPHSPAHGTLRGHCARAERIGLSTVIFTEHCDLTGWGIDAEDASPAHRVLIGADGILVPPLPRLDAFRAEVERCRRDHPGLRILTGVEFGQPHLDLDRALAVLDLAGLDRVNGSLHTLTVDGVRYEPITLYRRWPADRVITDYLAEAVVMAGSDAAFPVFTHLDYAVRSWPTERLGPFDPYTFEEPFRAAMRAIAASGRALELNVGVIRPWIAQWWAQEGGRAVSFGSDAHTPDRLAANFPDAVAMAEQNGFRRGRRPEDFWTR
ncbi:histidinol-phosphatase (PHP family) [Friedmanniella endophytica]|uniref:Histidinol-phosphatase (PHP family) n=1 Tax=Microlunatus kandeliicorticis TaxID=1759536 RepID=A0A7W3P6V8_9ACTN|nr:PHP domain-containing protein [Microlunatus kandeliicorticis]MBA8795342.1 histidinol-phosphatase (PHP family) [Microlunatus kandeliicorticis]